MEDSIAKSIWYNQDKQQYFLIPDDIELEDGDYTIHSMSGIAHDVKFDSIAMYLSDAKTAHETFENALNQSIECTRVAFINLKAFYDTLDPNDPLRDKSTAKRTEDIEHLVSQLFNDQQASPTPQDEHTKQLLKGIESYITGGLAGETYNEISDTLKKIASQLENPENQRKSINDLISILIHDIFGDPEKENNDLEARIQHTMQDAISNSLNKQGFEVFKGVKKD